MCARHSHKAVDCSPERKAEQCLEETPPSRARTKGKGEVTRYMIDTRSNRWTPMEDDAFRKMAEANIRPELIAAKLNRSVHAIKARAYAIGLPLKWFKLKAKAK